MTPLVRTHLPNLAFASFMAGAFCAVSRELYGNDGQVLTLDRIVMSLILPGLIYLSAFGAVHIVMTMLRRGSRWVYVLGSSAALLLAFCCSAVQQVLPTAQQSGVVSVILLLPILFGAMLGYLYHRRAGPALDADDPAAVANAAEGGEGKAAHLSVAADEYFDGPLQVRTSASVIVLAGVGAGFAWAILSFAFISLMMMGSMGPIELMKAWNNGLLSFATTYGVAAVVVGAVLIPIPVFVGHLICRALHWTSYIAYAGVGLGLGILVSLFGLAVIGILIAVPCAAGLTFYRYLAGLEPLRLPEDIEVSDRRTLIGADHARRRYRRIING